MPRTLRFVNTTVIQMSLLSRCIPRHSARFYTEIPKECFLPSFFSHSQWHLAGRFFPFFYSQWSSKESFFSRGADITNVKIGEKTLTFLNSYTATICWVDGRKHEFFFLANSRMRYLNMSSSLLIAHTWKYDLFTLIKK